MVKMVRWSSSHIVFGSIWRYSMVLLQYPRTTMCKHSDKILNTGKYHQYRHSDTGYCEQNSFLFTIPWNTLSNCWQPYGNTSDTAGYLWQPWILKSSSVHCSLTNMARESYMNMNILATTVEYMMVFGLPTSNTECTQIPYGKWAFRGQVPLYFTGFQKRQRNKVVQKWRHASCLFTCASALWLPEESKGHIHPQGWGWVHCNVMKSSSPDQIFLISVSKTDY